MRKFRELMQDVALSPEDEERYHVMQVGTQLRYTWTAMLVTILFQLYNICYTLIYTHGTLSTTSSKVYLCLYIIMLSVTGALVLYRFAALRHSYPPERTLRLQTAYAAFSMLWALAITLYDQRVSDNVTTYLSLAIFLSLLIYFKPLQALLTFGVPQLILVILWWRQYLFDGSVYGQLISTTAVAAMSFFIACYRYYAGRYTFAEHQTILRQNQQIQDKNKLLELLVHRDDLTGIYNRRFLKAYLPVLCAQAQSLRQPLTVFMVDIDDFKTYNDSFGHQRGDTCLRLVAQAMNVQMSQGYFLRYGGEEFCGIVMGLSPSEALEEGRSLCEAVEALKLDTAEPHRYVTVSIGVFTAVPERPDQWKEMINKADKALYQAKKLGKNQAVFDGAQNECPCF
ncbi:GGDEF domain-containing protein [Zongyangia hominis]|uniref:GGDEF domain-containing protein n=1 Tax=Zongyangia hominis TaxID=2763677 RepID=A0A926IB23_9FIRM|nr:GGDEF domain-containing protein [Zongyangia hominis]MBC8570796.1 GGDEF domain-containing protein [Zongyangia hominis]